MLAISVAVKNMNASHVTRRDIHALSFIGFATASFTIVPRSYSIVRKLHDKNIGIKILSPMPLRISQYFARSVGIIASSDVCITGADLVSMSDGELREYVAHVNIFSELEFADELRIARVFEDAGHRILHHEFSRH